MVNICLICDFFYPCLGGVEMHIFQLGLCLIERGHKVIVITHRYQGRSGVRYMTNGLKVYYCPFIPAIQTVVLFTYVGTLPIFRQILLREEIHVVHSHAATSYLGGELLLHAKSMGFKTVFTDHSLFAFNDASSFHVNKILKYILCEIDHSISVSHVSKENLSMRASLDPRNISVIPNAVDCSRFTPNPQKRYPLNTINIVVICRMTFRKGVDLLVDVLQIICKQHPEVYFIIGGDGPKKRILEETIQRYNLQNQTELLGSVPGHQVKDVLNRGHIFLNTSLTEAFCIAIVEAASCGLCVVSTNVGGISEVLPKNMVLYADPNPEDICQKIVQAIPIAKNFQVYQQHELIKKMYSWEQVAERTEKVYYKILQTQNQTILKRFKDCYSNGQIYGLYLMILLILDLIFLRILDFLQPHQTIQKSGIFNKIYKNQKEKFGDHQFKAQQQI
ncbi:unnamed protein product [Paramecium pentaurelia]|uniref:phosphatidylinositol N-acetylglucosaminyltransferase n=1 Tax=Paramecium pentaurelia TaxID=43138 RepID=A0A8S1SDJ4_9CILI|nr:unnamed protein product [Paramecium pentaurelia]